MLLHSSHLLLIDVQEKLFERIHEKEKLLQNLKIALQACDLLKIPVTISEQYPQGLGRTLPCLMSLIPASSLSFEKKSFACTEDAFLKEWFMQKPQKTHFVLIGIEAHICVLLTAIGLKDLGFQVSVLVDGVGSRNVENKKIALKEMQYNDIQITSLETFLFKNLKNSDHQNFKKISQLLK